MYGNGSLFCLLTDSFVTITQYVLIPSPKLLQSTTLYRLRVRLRKNADNSVTVLYMREMHDDDAVNRVVNKEKSWKTVLVDNAVLTRGDLAVPAIRMLQYGPCRVAGPSTWNSLPAPLHSCHLTSTFRRDMKTELFIRAYHHYHACDCFWLCKSGQT